LPLHAALVQREAGKLSDAALLSQVDAAAPGIRRSMQAAGWSAPVIVATLLAILAILVPFLSEAERPRDSEQLPRP